MSADLHCVNTSVQTPLAALYALVVMDIHWTVT